MQPSFRIWLGLPLLCGLLSGAEPPESPTKEYQNRLTPVTDPQPILADHPKFIEPVRSTTRLKAPALIDDSGATLRVRAWRWSYNARGVIEMENRLDGKQTALIVVHPWGIDDGQGWRTPQPAGCAFQCTPEKNQLIRAHIREVVDPLLKRMRPSVSLVMYSLPGSEDAIRGKIYRSMRTKVTPESVLAGKQELRDKLGSFKYRGQPVPATLKLRRDLPVVDYFKQFPGLDAGAQFNGEGFWKLPIPVIKEIDVDLDDVVIYDAEGYNLLKEFLQANGVRHVLLTGYNTDMCICSTTAGYENLRRDFNVFLVGDATIATFPANSKPAYATNAAVSFAALNLLITQASWIQPLKADGLAPAAE